MLGSGQLREVLALRGVRIIIERAQALAITARRREGILIALGGQAFRERTFHVQPGGFSEVACQLTIDVNCAARVFAPH
ncbi:MAG TPA: hypothetical protein VMU31_06485 [Rhizomicrobium sp.]|nr:hypothetical protein [Rhizomicrobium sp.]